jgi:basic membrane lipoprotein Med (substrate-binding protein (PBP1-ABC) superfamily)
MIKIKKVYVITPVYLTYTEKLTEREYKDEIKAVKEEIKKGAREFAYSVKLREGKTKIIESL